MLEKTRVVDRIEVTRDGHIQIRHADLYLEDGKEVAKTYHRYALSPGDKIADDTILATDIQRIKDISDVIWTTEVIADYNLEIESRKLDS